MPARVDRARALLGVPFRLHGRQPETGLDCVGLVAQVTGCPAPTGYAMRGGSAGSWAALLDKVLARRTGVMQPGDVLLLQAGPFQFHLGLWTGSGLIHADAGLRRVVETPGAMCWPVHGIWGRKRGIL